MPGNLLRIDPRTLPGFFAWYDANWISGFGQAQPADAAAVSQWNDLGPNGKHLLQGTGANQPLFRLTGGPNNMPAVNFVDSTDTMTVATAGTVLRPITVITVAKNTLADDAALHKCFTFNAGRIGTGLDWATANAYCGIDDNAAQAGGTIAGDTTTYHVQSMVAQPSGSTTRSGCDGTHLSTAGATGTNTNSDVTASGGGANGWIGHLCEAMVFTGELLPPMIFALEQALAEKWNLFTSYKIAA